MMQILKSRENSVDSEVDQGYSSARTSPNQTPSTSPMFHVSPASSTSSASSRGMNDAYRQRPIDRPDTSYSVLDLDESNLSNVNVQQDYFRLPTVDVTLQRVNNPVDYRYCRSRRLIDASLEPGQSTNVAVKRGLDSNMELERKRYRLTTQMSQVVLWLSLVRSAFMDGVWSYVCLCWLCGNCKKWTMWYLQQYCISDWCRNYSENGVTVFNCSIDVMSSIIQGFFFIYLLF